jgi:hypothetical protein
MNITVDQGRVHVNIVKVLQKTDEAVLILVDTRDKNPCLFGTGFDTDGSYEVALEPQSASSIICPKLTRITIHGLGEGWKMAVETGRYATFIHLIKPGKKDAFEEYDWWERDNG